jgi:conjugative transfer region protein (TIGR03750 family)
MAHEGSDHDDIEESGDGRVPLTDLVNVEPPILNGMTSTEATYVGIAAFVLWLILGGILAWLVGFWQLILGVATFGPVVTVWLASQRFASIKRDRPDGFYMQQVRRWMAGIGLRQSRLIDYSGRWSLGRSLPNVRSASSRHR